MISDSPLMILGIFHPVRRSGRTIYPIAIPVHSAYADYSINQAQKSDKALMKGLNGEVSAFSDGSNTVVKKLYSAKQANNFSPTREIKALVALEVNGICGPGIQTGFQAVKNADGDTYIVSSQINGSKPHPDKNKFNPQNMSEMAKVLAYLDTPGYYWNHKKPFRVATSPNLLMHYDLKPGNVLITDKHFGVIDFEYLDFLNLFLSKRKLNKQNWGILCNCSDLPEIPSNLRSFEYRSLLPYIEKMEPNEAPDLFKDYLIHKSTYHELMADSYKKLKRKVPIFTVASLFNSDNSPKRKTEKIIQGHLAHSEVLRKPTSDVIKAEAIKIQISRYIYLLSTHAHGEKTELNLEQIRNYIINAQKFFSDQNKNASGARQIYYQNCLDLINRWIKILPIIQNGQMKEKLDYYRDISGTSDAEVCPNGMYETTFTTGILKTLDEIVKPNAILLSK